MLRITLSHDYIIGSQGLEEIREERAYQCRNNTPNISKLEVNSKIKTIEREH